MIRLEELKQKLEKNGNVVSVFETAKEAAVYLDSKIDNKLVGIGGSGTVNVSGVYELLKTHNEVHWHWKSGA